MNTVKKILAFGITVLVTTAVIWAVFRFVPGLSALDVKHAAIAGAGVTVVNLGVHWGASKLAGVREGAESKPQDDKPVSPSNGTAADNNAAPKITG